MDKKSRRDIDSRGEKALGLFLDKYFYLPMLQRGEAESFTRIYDRKSQLDGIDLKLLIGDKEFKVDEKGQLYSINCPKNTFALEIDYISSETNEPVSGWYLSKDNMTDMYLFIWIDKAKENRIERLVANDFEELSIVMIEKKTLKNYLQAKKLSTQGLSAIAREMRKEGYKRKTASDGMHFVLSDVNEYVEAPVNLVIPRKILEDISFRVYKVSKKEIEMIRKN